MNALTAIPRPQLHAEIVGLTSGAICRNSIDCGKKGQRSTRHSGECPKKDNPQWKRFNCRKSVYIYEDGRKSYVSAKTRSWKQAEKFAQSERDKRDPVKAELQKIAELRATDEEAAAARELNQVTIEDALDRWARSRKQMSQGTVPAYRLVVRKIKDWRGIPPLR